MRLIGLLGGMSWESSAEYYRLANELVRERVGGLASARLLLHSVDFADIERLQAEGRWDALEADLIALGERFDTGDDGFLARSEYLLIRGRKQD